MSLRSRGSAIVAACAALGAVAALTLPGGGGAADAAGLAPAWPGGGASGCAHDHARRRAVPYTITQPTPDGPRSTLVRVPAGPPRARPLLIALHGAGGNGPFMATYSGLGPLADQAGFIAAFPSALGSHHRWNFGPGRPDDVHFLAQLTTTIARTACVDRSRVFFVGVSNGGGMAARMGCVLAERVAGIAVVAGGFKALPPCRPARPVSVLEIHGSDDPVVPYRGDPGDGRRGSVPRWLRRWRRADGCSPHARRTEIAPRTVRYVWPGCRDRTRLVHLLLLGGQHAWPGADPPDPGPPAAISGAKPVWGFFRSLGPRRSPHRAAAPASAR